MSIFTSSLYVVLANELSLNLDDTIVEEIGLSLMLRITVIPNVVHRESQRL